jgi:hypothetical protein
LNDVKRAISDIENIRAQLAASTRFQGIAPRATALTGLLAFLVAVAQTLWPETFAQDALRYVSVWAAVTIVSIVIAASEAISRSRRCHTQATDALLSTTVRQILPFGAAGAIITVVVCEFSIDSAWLLPGLWQILIALTGFSALPSLPRAIMWAAGWYFLCGSVVLVLAGWSGVLSPWMMGAPLAIGQSAVALIMYFAEAEFHQEPSGER